MAGLRQVGSAFFIKGANVNPCKGAIEKAHREGPLALCRGIDVGAVLGGVAIERMFELWGFSVSRTRVDPSGDAQGPLGMIETTRSDVSHMHHFFNVIAPFVTAGSYIAYIDDGFEAFRWAFDGAGVEKQQGRTAYFRSGVNVDWKNKHSERGLQEGEEAERRSLRTRASDAEGAVGVHAAEVHDRQTTGTLRLDIIRLMTDLRILCDREGFNYDIINDESLQQYELALQPELDAQDVEI